jgi:tellurite resistance protein
MRVGHTVGTSKEVSVALNESRVRERYGRMPKSEADVVSYFQALKLIASADGSFPDKEKKALDQGMTRLGVPDAVRKTVTAFDPKGQKLETVLGKFKTGGLRARMLVRDAIELSRADGVYSAKEKAAVAQAAKLVGVDAAMVKTIESLVELEHAVKHLRKSLFPKHE